MPPAPPQPDPAAADKPAEPAPKPAAVKDIAQQFTRALQAIHREAA
jgi:hypothetical protein